MRNWLTQQFKKTADSLSDDKLTGLTLRAIGDRASGKTTYVAALARWPNADPASTVEAVTASSEEGVSLIAQAQNILEQGLTLKPTRLDAYADVTDLKDYRLRVVLKQQFSLQIPQLAKGSSFVMDLDCKDYPGEFFSELLHQADNPLLQSYLEDCLEANGILFCVDGIAYRKDTDYARGLSKFLTALESSDKVSKRRMAMVLTKCEQPDLWINRHKPRELTIARFPEVYQQLETWHKLGKGRVEYFTTSAFGVLGTHAPEPNSKQIRRDREGVVSIIKEPKHWRPFGLIAPIYWLYTGKHHKDLEKG